MFPTDDDDWFGRDAIACVVEKKPTSLARWNYTEFMLGKIVRNLKVENDWGCFYRYQTNNYAIVTPKPSEFLNSHYPDVSGNFPDELLISSNLSIHNKTPASLSHPRKSCNPEELLCQVDDFVRNADSINLPEFSQEIDMLLELFGKTRPRKIF